MFLPACQRPGFCGRRLVGRIGCFFLRKKAEPFGLRPLRGKCRRAAGCEDYIARQVWKERKQDTLTFCCESFTGAGTLWYTSNQYGGREVRISHRMAVEEGRGEAEAYRYGPSPGRGDRAVVGLGQGLNREAR